MRERALRDPWNSCHSNLPNRILSWTVHLSPLLSCSLALSAMKPFLFCTMHSPRGRARKTSRRASAPRQHEVEPAWIPDGVKLFNHRQRPGLDRWNGTGGPKQPGQGAPHDTTALCSMGEPSTPFHGCTRVSVTGGQTRQPSRPPLSFSREPCHSRGGCATHPISDPPLCPDSLQWWGRRTRVFIAGCSSVQPRGQDPAWPSLSRWAMGVGRG